MASNITAESVLAEISQGHLECPICCERFKQPKRLECSHSFCLECLQQLKKKSPSTTKLSCPVCRQETLIKENGIDGLKTDFKSLSLLIDFETQEKRLKLQHEQGQQVPSEESVYKCTKHTDNNLIMYCDTCKTLICTTCIAKDHRTHPAMELHEALDKSKHHAQELLSKVIQSIKTFNNAIQEIDMSRKTLDSMFAATKEKISKKADEEIAKEVARIRKEEQILMQEAEQIFQDRVKTMETARATNSKEVTKEEHKHEEVNQLMDHGSCCEILSQIQKHFKHLEEYTVMLPNKVPDGLNYMDFKDIEKSLGRLVLKDKWMLKTEMNTYLSQALQMEKLYPCDVVSYSNGDKIVSDLSSPNLIALSAESNLQSIAIPQALSIKGLTTPPKVTVSKNDELIVLDGGTVKIFNRNYQLTHEFKPHSKPSCIAVNDNNLIAVGYQNKAEISLHKPDGSLIRTLPAPGIGKYLTTYKQQFIYTRRRDKCLVSVDLNGIAQFSVHISLDQIGCPCGVCCDRDGSIYVAVWKRQSPGEIQHYSPDGKYIGCIIKGCIAPRGITITPAGDLVVATNDSVQIYHHE